MIKPYEIIATVFYSGYIKPASGTWGTLASLPFCLLVTYHFGIIGVTLGSLGLFFLGLWSAHEYQKQTKQHDSPHIVIDEAAGMMIACLPLTIHWSWQTIIACFILFRVFDAIKKGPVGWCDRHVSGALGVMIDDIVAGLLTTILILLAFLF